MSLPSWLRDLQRQLLAPRLGAARHGRTRNTLRTRLFVRPSLERLEDRITPTGPTLSTLVSFPGANSEGSMPASGVIRDSSGNLYGTTGTGGVSGQGTIFELAQGSSTITTLASFNGANGAIPYARLLLDSSGNLYGTTLEGGASGQGTIFELAKGSSTITTLASFNGTNQARPFAGLIEDGNGNLYGTTEGGVASDRGTVFELAKGSNTITTLATFDGSNGQGPASNLVLDSSGNLYGLTVGGGASGNGTIFEVTKGSNTITTLASLNSTSEDFPLAISLVMDTSGNLYGTTEGGGVSGDGTIFELAKGSSTITTLASFNGSNGVSPDHDLVLDDSGNLYGTTEGNNAASSGTVFELAKGSSTITTLATFNGTYGNSLQNYPRASGLILDNNGNLYGTTMAGGAWDGGTVFELAKGSGTITTLASFYGDNGLEPYAGPIVDGNGNLYGTTLAGGASGYGTVFELAKGSDSITRLASFNFDNGAYPYAGLVMDGNGNLYGTTRDGGASDDGTIFELVKDSNTITTLASFNGSNGANPWAALIMDGNGNLYGTTLAGGAYRQGAIFELAKGSSTITTLASFDGSNGANPYAGLVMDSSGNLYGTTFAGGASRAGTVFELAQGSSSITQLASFNVSNGEMPYGGLVMDSDGNLYGTTSEGGGSPNGTVFELVKGSSTITTLATFNGSNGTNPFAGLILDSNGNLYGTTGFGGASGDGTVFELAQGSGTIITLVSFNSSNGGNLHAGLVMDSSGNLYGATLAGGAYGFGTLFEVQGVGSGALTITGQPSSQTVTAGANVSFQASASGNPTPTVQWKVSTNGGIAWGNVSGATSPTLTLTDVTTAMNGNEYAAFFTNSSGSAATAPAKLTVNPSSTSPSIAAANAAATFRESTQNVTLTANVTSSTGAVNEGTVTFTLKQGSTVIGTSTTSNTVSNGFASVNYALPAGTAAGSYTIDAVYNPGPDFTTNSDNSHSLTVNPASTTVTAANATTSFSNSAQNVTLTANVTSNAGAVNEGTVTFTLKQGSTVIGAATTSNTVHNGSASVSYALPGGAAAGTYTIDAVYNPGLDFTTNSDGAHSLTIQLGPTVTANPTNQTVIAGGTATFTAAANGNPAPTVQWQVSSNGGKTWTNINNATTTTLTLTNVSFALNGNEYRAVFSSSLGTTPTSAATLTVHTPPAITSGNNAVFTVGQNGSFLVTSSGFPAPALTVSGMLPSGITFTNYGNGTASVGGTPAAGTNGTYYIAVIAHNGVGSGVTQNFTLTVNSVPVPPPSPPPNPAPPNVPVLLSLFNLLLPHTETVNANGITITDSLFGIPLVEMYDYSGNLVSVTLFGFNITFLFV